MSKPTPGREGSMAYGWSVASACVSGHRQDGNQFITNARKKGDRYFLIQKKVDYATLKKLKELPIFREGQYKEDCRPSLRTGGFYRTVSLRKNHRLP